MNNPHSRSIYLLPVAAIFALSWPVCALGQVLNLSTDLVTIGIAASNMTPDTPSLDARPLFQAGVSYAAAHGIPTVTADRGSYYFLSLNSQYQHVYLSQISNLTVDLNHSDLYFAYGNIMAIEVHDGMNLTLKNFTLDYRQLPFTQLKVTTVDTTAKTIGFTKLGEFPLPSTFNSRTVPSSYVDQGYYAFVFRDGKELRATGRMSVSTASAFNDTSIQLAGTEPWTTAAQLGAIKAGDTLVLEWRAGTAAIYATGTTGFTVEDVSVYASGYVGVLVETGSKTTVDHVQVIPRPGTTRMISTNTGGIALGKAGANNQVTNNTVRRTCDDAIAMNGEWSAVVAKPSNGVTVNVTRFLTSPLRIGDKFDFINILDASIEGTATIVDERPKPIEQSGDANEAIKLTLDHAIAGLLAGFGVTAHNPDLRGGGTAITGNLARDITFGRGIYPAGVANVTVENNMTEATSRTGIVVEQDEANVYDYKTGPSSGIAIRNNIVDNPLGFGVPLENLLTDAAGINVIAYNEYFDWVSTQSLTDISIDNNFVSNSVRSGIRMENVGGGSVSGNQVQNTGTNPDDSLWFLPVCTGCETLSQVEAEFAEPVVVVNSDSVTDSGNVTAGTPVIHSSFADGSFRLAPLSIAAAVGHDLAVEAPEDGRPPLPQASPQVTVKDSKGVSRSADVLSATPGKVVYVIPENTAPGVATVTIGSQTGGALISSVAPALFSADGTGSGVALATAWRVTSGGVQVPETVYKCAKTCVPVPLNLGMPTDTLVVDFHGTGIRGRSSLANVIANVGGDFAQVDAATALPGGTAGTDHVEVQIPHSLAGAGVVPVVLTVDGFTADVVTIGIQ